MVFSHNLSENRDQHFLITSVLFERQDILLFLRDFKLQDEVTFQSGNKIVGDIYLSKQS